MSARRRSFHKILVPFVLVAGEAAGQTTFTASLVNPGASIVYAGQPFELDVVATFDRRLAAVAFQVAAAGEASARLTGRSADPDESNGLTYISGTSQEPFAADLPHDFTSGPVTEMLVDMDYDDVPGGQTDGVPPASNVVIERLQITPGGTGSLTITLSGFHAATTQDDPDGAAFDTIDVQPNAVTVTVATPIWDGHPGDTNRDWIAAIDEVTAYAACWKNGCAWSVPPTPIPMAYVTRMGFLWSVGEHYHLDTAYVCNEDVAACYQPGAPQAVKNGQAAQKPLVSDVAAAVSFGATRVIEPIEGVPGQYRVRIDATPPGDARSWALEETPPVGWIAREVSDDGTVDIATGRVRWGLFWNGEPRPLSYTLVSGGDALPMPQGLAGVISADGRNAPVSAETPTTADEEQNLNEGEPEAPLPVTALCGAGVCEAALGLSGITLLFCRRKRRSG